MSRGDGTHSSLFWFFAGALFLISMFLLFYVLPRLLAHFFPGVGIAIFGLVIPRFCDWCYPKLTKANYHPFVEFKSNQYPFGPDFKESMDLCEAHFKEMAEILDKIRNPKREPPPPPAHESQF